MPRLSRATLVSATWHALAKHAAREADREILADGACYPLEITIASRSGQAQTEMECDGELVVGHESRRASAKACNQAELLAVVLAHLPKAKRIQLRDAIPEKFARDGKLPHVDPAEVKAAEMMLGRLRHRTEQTAKGPVSFRPHVRAEAA